MHYKNFFQGIAKKEKFVADYALEARSNVRFCLEGEGLETSHPEQFFGFSLTERIGHHPRCQFGEDVL